MTGSGAGSPVPRETGPMPGAWPPAWRALGGLAAFICLYVALDWMSVIEPFGELGITPWNPPAGLLFALLLLRGARYVLPAFGAVVLADLLLRGGATTPFATLASALIIALGYGWAAMYLRERRRISSRLDSHHDLLWLLAVSLGAAAVIALAVVWVLATSGLIAWSEFSVVALRYWIGDVIGIAVLTPFLLLLFDRDRRVAAVRGWTALEAALQLAAIGLGLAIIFGLQRTQHFEFAYVLFLPLIWIALRDGLMGATWGIVATQLGLIVAIQMKGYDAHIVTQFQLLMLAVTVSGLFLGAVVDERRRAETSLREHEAQLAHATRLMTTGEMAAAIAHELNQPLTAVIGFVRACQGLLQSTTADSADTRRQALELIDQAVLQASRAGQIIRSTREFLKRDDMRCVRTAVTDIVAAVLDLVRAEARQNSVEIVRQIDDGLPPVLVDPIQIEQVIINLIRNSIEAMARAGAAERTITVSAALGAGDPGFVEIGVRDSGPGFPPEIADRLFTPFATTKDTGMGLGLSISRSIIEAHGGRIWAVSGPQAGAEIRLTLPIYADDSAHGL